MSPNRVEVAKGYCLDIFSYSTSITDNLFIDLLGIAIGAFRLFERGIFCDRELVRLAIYSTRRTKDKSSILSLLKLLK